MPVKPSKLINDLNYVPNIVGALGLSIAAAQKAFNLDYLQNVERLIALARSIFGEKILDDQGKPKDMTDAQKAKLEQFASFLKELLVATAPPRYQFTETTLNVKLDLAQSMDLNVGAGLGVGFGAVTVSASLAIGYGYDYRAAAECHTVIHAIPADPNVFRPLLDRAKEVNDKMLALSDPAGIDNRIIEQSRAIFEQVMGVKAPTPVEAPK